MNNVGNITNLTMTHYFQINCSASVTACIFYKAKVKIGNEDYTKKEREVEIPGRKETFLKNRKLTFCGKPVL